MDALDEIAGILGIPSNSSCEFFLQEIDELRNRAARAEQKIPGLKISNERGSLGIEVRQVALPQPLDTQLQSTLPIPFPKPASFLAGHLVSVAIDSQKPSFRALETECFGAVTEEDPVNDIRNVVRMLVFLFNSQKRRRRSELGL